MSNSSQTDLLFGAPAGGIDPPSPPGGVPPSHWADEAAAAVGAAKWKGLDPEQRTALVNAMWVYACARAGAIQSQLTAGQAERRLQGWLNDPAIASAIRLLNTTLPLASRGDIPTP